MRKLLLVLLCFFLLSEIVFSLNYTYMVVDLNNGNISYLESAPAGGWANEYKTTKLVLRKMTASTFTMGTPVGEAGRLSFTYNGNESLQHSVTLSSNYYIGVFEVTQKQWYLVKGTQASTSFVSGDTIPAHSMSWNNIRGGTWPESPASPSSTSFVGKLNTLTGLQFDLPTEAQWEYACRAGTTKGLNTPPLGADYSASEAAKVSTTLDPTGNINPTNVGTLIANNWGLYDMHGNIGEYTLDWIYRDGSRTYPSGNATDPVGLSTNTSNTMKAVRGSSDRSGGIRCGARMLNLGCPSSGAASLNCAEREYSAGPGFRVIAKAPTVVTKQCSSLPQNAEWNDNGQSGLYYGSATVTSQYNTTAGDCHWVCKQNYNINQTQTTCTAATQSKKCGGTLPQNAAMNDGGKDGNFTQTWNGTTFYPTDLNLHHNSTQEDCAWECTTGYGYSNNACITNQQIVSCNGTIPTGSKWNDNGQNGKFTQQLINSTWTPTTDSQIVEYSVDANNCKWKCDENHYIDSTKKICLEKYRKITQCNLSDSNGILPNDAVWNDLDSNSQNDGLFTQINLNETWTPTSKNAYYSEDKNECAYRCNLLSQDCQPTPELYCGKGTQSCNSGYWGSCEPNESSFLCSKNQYCDTNTFECEFCNTGYKNCDSNLLSGCETNTLTDVNNCGACDNNCPIGILCTNGVCEGMAPVDLCANITCNTNMFCNTTSGECDCNSGKYNCDNNVLNGCESNTICQIIQPPVEPPISPPQNVECTIDSNCDTNKKCENNTCVDITCESNYTIENKSCLCKFTECGGACFSETGVCCKNNWNPKLESCEYSTDSGIEIINKSANKEAIEMMQRANQSISEGKVLKGQVEAMLAELRAKIDLAGDSKAMLEKYEEAKTALNEGNYDKAKLIIEETTSAMGDPQNGNLIIPIILGILLVIVVLVAINMLKKKPQTPDIKIDYEK